MKVFELNKATTKYKSTIIDREEKFAKGSLDRVILTLKAGKGTPEELIAKHIELKQKIDELTAERKKLTEDLKNQIGALFKAEEKVLTRVVKTANFAATLSGEYMNGAIDVVDYEAIVNEALTSLTPKAIELLEELKQKYTKVNEAQAVVSRLTTSKEKEAKESIGEGNDGFTHRHLKEQSFISRMHDWLRKYTIDALSNIISKINAYDLALERLEIKANLKREND